MFHRTQYAIGSTAKTEKIKMLQLQTLLEAEEKKQRLGRQRLDIWLYRKLKKEIQTLEEWQILDILHNAKFN